LYHVPVNDLFLPRCYFHPPADVDLNGSSIGFSLWSVRENL